MAALYAFEHRQCVEAIEALKVVELEGRRWADAVELVARAASLVSSIRLPDPSEVELFNTRPPDRGAGTTSCSVGRTRESCNSFILAGADADDGRNGLRKLKFGDS